MNDFLDRIAKALKHITEIEREEILQDFREHFAIGKAQGKTEEAVAASLGNPEQLAWMYAAMGATQRARKSRRLKDARRMVGAMVRYKMGGGLLMGSLYFGGVLSLGVLFTVAAALAVAGTVGIGLGVLEWIMGFAGYGFAALFAGVTLGAAGILGWLGTTWLWKKTIGHLPLVAQQIMQGGMEEEE